MTATQNLRDRLLSIVDEFAGVRVAILGDLLVDEFIYGRISRVSREAPVLILEYDSTDIVPGGAGNAANNVAALGGSATAIGVAGEDQAGRRLLEAMREQIDVRSIVTHRSLTTPTKTRILAGGVHSAKQQVVRVDRTAGAPVPEQVRTALGRRLSAALARSDALLVSDYGSGLVTPALVRTAQRTLRGPGSHQPPVLVDSRYSLLKYRRMTMCTPNESEVEALLGVRIGEDSRVLERAGRTLLARTGAAGVLITRGSRGMALFEPNRATLHIPIFGSDQIADVTGAGDTVIATMTLALAAGGTADEAARLANYAGGLVVMKRGTATVTADELKQAIRADRA
ncbi:MAG TPA: PfkB family carbohydrate kinase [Vicinamibacterales bacterium]|nr:PfkB family carbohydrate kinase [Vicinamibacterales bacterium]